MGRGTRQAAAEARTTSEEGECAAAPSDGPGARVRIEIPDITGMGTKVWINGVQVPALKGVAVSAEVDDLATVHLVLLARQVSVDAPRGTVEARAVCPRCGESRDLSGDEVVADAVARRLDEAR